METKEKTTPKKVQNILYEHVQGKLGFNADSPFKFLPNFSTPPSSRLPKIFNPFEAHLTERLHLPVFSPSVFTKAPSPKTEEKFKWTIDEISSLKPADIDVTSLDQYECLTDHDTTSESKVQEKINTFFSKKVIVPSPFNPNLNSQPLINEMSSPPTRHDCATVSVQTLLSLPPVLPRHVEEVLGPYFTTPSDLENGNSVDQELYNKLFEYENQSTPQSAQTSPALSVGLSPIDMSPLQGAGHEGNRKSGIFSNTPTALRHCNLSPIESSTAMSVEAVRDRRSAARLHFSSQMSVDSVVLVPDAMDPDVPNKSLTFDCTGIGSPVPQELSSANWDIEYKHVSLVDDSSTEMDISQSNTPRSKIFYSQRKKLSDSFIREDFGNDDICTAAVDVCKKAKDDTDVGYQTGSILLSEDSNWGSRMPLFASTPTKGRKRVVSEK